MLLRYYLALFLLLGVAVGQQRTKQGHFHKGNREGRPEGRPEGRQEGRQDGQGNRRYFTNRDKIPHYLEMKGYQTGAEVGVQNGAYALKTLKIWKNCTKYYLIDLWAKQTNYIDGANVEDTHQIKNFKDTKEKLKAWQNKTEFMKMYSTEAAKMIPNNTLDWVYIDARHDYCGVYEDIVNYWPKLKSGGLIGGHDYKDAWEVKRMSPGNNWSKCSNGEIHHGAVKGAVQRFAKEEGLNIIVTATSTTVEWPSWLMWKK